MKKTLVTLECSAIGVTKNFEIAHAERILKMPNNGGWKLPKDSKFTFDDENGIRFIENKTRDNGATQSGDN